MSERQKIITLNNRYGYDVHLEHIDINTYKLIIDNNCNYFSIGGAVSVDRYTTNYEFIDPEGGPFISIGTDIGGGNVIERIYGVAKDGYYVELKNV